MTGAGATALASVYARAAIPARQTIARGLWQEAAKLDDPDKSNFPFTEAMRYFGFSLSPVGLVFSKLLRRPYPVAESGDKKKNPIAEKILRTMLQIDRRVPVPFGTSLLFKGIRKLAPQAKRLSKAA